LWGGAALFCNLCPKSAVINDINPKLINVYKAVKTDSVQLIAILNELQSQFNGYQLQADREAFYYEIRDKFNTEPLSTAQAAHFIFLNKTCFNGLYRENRNGQFNASFNKCSSINLYEPKNITKFAELLQNTTILNTDFEKACETATTGDFVFFDSPYYGTFDKYTHSCFSEQDHIRLFRLAENLTEAGCCVMLTNSDCDYIRNLYSSFKITQVPVKRLVNCDADNRVGSEVIITNY
jgi:DNA adenine methylase